MNKILTLTLLLSLALGAAAQQKAAPKQPAKKKAAPPAAAPAKPAVKEAKPAEAPTAAPAEDPAAAVIEKLKAWDAKLESLKADFTQEVNFKEAGLKQTIEGNLRYVKPNLLRIEHLKPSRQLVVTDKTDIWIYKPADNQVVRTAWEAWRRTQDQNFSGILDFGNYAALTARNTTKVTGGSDGAPLKITFIPRSGKDYSLTLTLSSDDYFPVEAELTVETTVIKTTLTAVEKNAAVDKELFKFTKPKGVEVLEFGN
jgi:outer membrane lipoprotein-sorting protein